jgi:hypothetical protein
MKFQAPHSTGSDESWFHHLRIGNWGFIRHPNFVISSLRRQCRHAVFRQLVGAGAE